MFLVSNQGSIKQQRRGTGSAYHMLGQRVMRVLDKSAGSLQNAIMIRDAKSLLTLMSPCATLTFQSKETRNGAFICT